LGARLAEILGAKGALQDDKTKFQAKGEVCEKIRE
jgi:hypothetical protein